MSTYGDGSSYDMLRDIGGMNIHKSQLFCCSPGDSMGFDLPLSTAKNCQANIPMSAGAIPDRGISGSRDLVGVMKIVQMGPGTVASWTFFDRFHPKRPWMHRFSTEKILESLEVHWSLAVFSHVRFFFWRFNWRSFRVSSASRGVFWGCWGAPERRSFLVSMSEIEAWIGRWYKSMF